MSDDWRKQKNQYFDNEMAFARRFDQEIMRILKNAFNAVYVDISDKSNDIERNTDYLVHQQNGNVLRIAARVRRNDKQRFNNLTIRSSLANNRIEHDGDTELQKMAQGWGDFGIYAIASKDESHIVSWKIYDLDKVRKIIDSGGLDDAPENTARNTGCKFKSMSFDTYSPIIEAEWEES